MEKKLKIGDKIAFIDEFPYTVVNIDYEKDIIVFSWKSKDGHYTMTYDYSIQDFNQFLNKGDIIIMGHSLNPDKYLPKFTFKK